MDETKCKKIKNNLSAYFDNELEDEEFMLVEEHLRKCEGCRAELKNIILLSKTLKDFSSRLKYDLDDTCDKVMYSAFEKDKPNCVQVEKKLLEYTNGELEIEEYYNIQEHINNCIYCRKQLEKLEKNKKEQRNIYIVKSKEDKRSCQQIRPMLPDFLDKELDKKESSIVAKHLLSCGDCRNIYDNLKLTQSAIKNYLSKTNPQDLREDAIFKRSRFWLISIGIIGAIIIFAMFNSHLISDLTIRAESRIDKLKSKTPVTPIYVNLGKKETQKEELD